MVNKSDTKTIVLSNDTYNKLKEKKKHPRQSFNEVVFCLLDEVTELKSEIAERTRLEGGQV